MASQQQLATRPQGPLDAFRGALARAQADFAQALPSTVKKFLTPERLTKITLVALSRSPMLLQCTPQSVLRSVMDAASLGLEPSGPLGHAYLVPYKNKNGTMEAQLIVGYRGFVALARRSGTVESVSAHVVYSRDIFEMNLAEGTVMHRPFMAELPPEEKFFAMSVEEVDELTSRGRMLGVYCVAKFIGGGQHVDFMTVGDVELIRRRSRARDSGPWQTDYTEMAKKTVVRRAAKYWPLSTEMAQALENEERAELGDAPALQVFAGDVPVEEAAPKSITEKVRGKLAAKQELAEEPAPRAPDEGIDEAEARWADVGPPPMDAETAAVGEEPAKESREEREARFRSRHKKSE